MVFYSRTLRGIVSRASGSSALRRQLASAAARISRNRRGSELMRILKREKKRPLGTTVSVCKSVSERI